MVTREELYALVWSTPVMHAARRLGVSDIYLARVCVALDVPRPPRGWWRKRERGMATEPPPLPVARPGVLDRWESGASLVGVEGQFRNVVVGCHGTEASDWHPLVRRSAMMFRRARPSDDGTHLAPRNFDAIDLICSAETLDRALSLANVLFNACEARGHRIAVANVRRGLTRPDFANLGSPRTYTAKRQPRLWKPKAPTIALIGWVPIGLAVVETRKEVLMRYTGHGRFEEASKAPKVYGISWTEWQLRPSGRLVVVAYSPHFPAPWEHRWPVFGGRMSKRAAEALVAELEGLAPSLPHAGFFKSDQRR